MSNCFLQSMYMFSLSPLYFACIGIGDLATRAQRRHLILFICTFCKSKLGSERLMPVNVCCYLQGCIRCWGRWTGVCSAGSQKRFGDVNRLEFSLSVGITPRVTHPSALPAHLMCRPARAHTSPRPYRFHVSLLIRSGSA